LAYKVLGEFPNQPFRNC